MYRISVALNSQGKQLEAWSYIKRAYAITPQDKAISELYTTLKSVKEQHQQKQKPETKSQKVEPEQAKDEELEKDNNKDNADSSDEDERAKSLKSGFKFTTDDRQTKQRQKEEVKIEEEKVSTS